MAAASMPKVLGMRREELLDCYAQHAVPLALPPMDAVCGFLHSLRAAYDVVATRYARILVPCGAAIVRPPAVPGAPCPPPPVPSARTSQQPVPCSPT